MEMNRQLADEFFRMFYKFCREYNVKPISPEIKTIIRTLDLDLHTNETRDRNYGTDYNKESQEYRQLSDILHSFVETIITYVNENPKIQEAIQEKTKQLTEEWNRDVTDDKLKIYPDISAFFGVDGLEDSIKNKEWTSASDASISIQVGRTNIINCM